MGLRKYIFGSIVLIGVVAGYSYSYLHLLDKYSVTVKQYTLELPIYAWIIAPAAVLFVFSLLHLLYYGMKNYFAIRSVEKDATNLTKLIAKRVVNEDLNVKISNNQLDALATVLKQVDISIEDMGFHSSNKELTKTAEKILDVKAGKFVKDLRLDNNNPLMIQNLKNRIISDDSFALEVIKKDSEYAKELVSLAFNKVLDTKSMTTVKKYIDEITFDRDMLLALLKKDSQQQSEFALSSEVILKLVKKVELTSDDMINIAKDYKELITPDNMIKLFEDIASQNDKYTLAYLYVLSEFQVIDKIREILEASKSDEYMAFRALIDLRDAGKHSYNLDSLCYK